MYHITTIGMTNEAALEALVLRMQVPSSRLGTVEDEVPLDTRTMALYEGRRTSFRRLKEGRVKAQPQLYGTSYPFAKITLTGHYKILAQRMLTTGDFEKAGKDKDFPLDFEVYLKIGGGEQKVEFCTISGESDIQVTFDSVRLPRR